MEPQYIVFKKSRAYYAGPGYQNYQPSSKAAAEAHAVALSAANVVGFEALPYVALDGTPRDGEAQAFMHRLGQLAVQDKTDAATWHAELRAAGVTAAFPDDAWANGEGGQVLTIFPGNKGPQFIDKVEVGARVAIGRPEKYRLVILVAHVPERYRMPGDSTTKYRYAAAEAAEFVVTPHS